jgi:hypothetical protein
MKLPRDGRRDFGAAMNAHWFVDESKSRGYLLAAAAIPPTELNQMRKLIDALRLPRQRRIHFTAESDSRRKAILGSFAAAGVTAFIYDASSHRKVQHAREAAMTRLVNDAVKTGASTLVIECDDEAIKSDKAIIRREVSIAGRHHTFRYIHQRAHEECLLAIPDALAWSWAKGGHWRQRAAPLVTQVSQV